jgi:hypothetical protein
VRQDTGNEHSTRGLQLLAHHASLMGIKLMLGQAKPAKLDTFWRC